MVVTHPYYQIRKFTTILAGYPIQYYSKPGLPEWDSIPISCHLLIDYAHLAEATRVWCINCGPGALTTALSAQMPQCTFFVSADDSISLACTEFSKTENNLSNLHIFHASINPPEINASIDLILMRIAKGRHLNRRWLIQAWHSLKSGAKLLIAGANDQGIQSVVKDAEELFHNYSILAYRKGNRVAQFIKYDQSEYDLPDWSKDPGIAPGTWNNFKIHIFEHSFDLVSLPGVFSSMSLDNGTQLLLSTLGDIKGEKVLDVGCGYGIIGIFAAFRGASTVELVDSQLISVASCQENLKRYHLDSCQAYPSDLLSSVKGKSFTYILSNPPFHAGYQVDYQIAQALIISAHSALEERGFLILVANRFIRYDRLMKEYFGNVSVLAQTSAYHVLSSKKLEYN